MHVQHFAKADLAFLHFGVDAPKGFVFTLYVAADFTSSQTIRRFVINLIQSVLFAHTGFSYFLFKNTIANRVHVREAHVGELSINRKETKAARNRSVDIHGLFSNTEFFMLLNRAQCAHVMKTVGKLN